MSNIYTFPISSCSREMKTELYQLHRAKAKASCDKSSFMQDEMFSLMLVEVFVMLLISGPWIQSGRSDLLVKRSRLSGPDPTSISSAIISPLAPKATQLIIENLDASSRPDTDEFKA